MPPTTAPPTTVPPTTEPVKNAVMGTVNATTLNIRAGAGTSYKIVGYLRNGARVEILEQKTAGGMTWGRIKDGWISLDYVELDNKTVTMTVTADCLRIRSDAGVSNRVVGYLYYGAKVQVLDTRTVNGVKWAKIDGGWVSMEYLK